MTVEDSGNVKMDWLKRYSNTAQHCRPQVAIAEVPGEYRGPASRAYLYYGAEHKHWAEPLAVAVRQPR